jgi:hypothetical protein
MITVTIRETSAKGSTWISKHRTSDYDLAFHRAIRKHFGSNTYFALNFELSGGNRIYPPRTIDDPRYGQMVVASGKYRGSTSTGTVRVDFDKRGHGLAGFYAATGAATE